MENIKNETEQWYKSYYSAKGGNRNDILTNPEVLFQKLALWKSMLEAFRTLPPKIVREGGKILDVGCGDGGSLLQVINLGFKEDCLYGIDIVPERIEWAKKKFSNIEFSCNDASKMDNYEANFFDIVMETTMFIQLTDDGLSQRIADEILRVTKSGGYIMLIDWRYGFGRKEMKALSRNRMAALFKIGDKTKIYSRKNGMLVPPIGRFLSKNFSSFYFFISWLFPFLVGQQTIVLKKIK